MRSMNDNQPTGSYFPILVVYDGEDQQTVVHDPRELRGTSFRVVETCVQYRAGTTSTAEVRDAVR